MPDTTPEPLPADPTTSADATPTTQLPVDPDAAAQPRSAAVSPPPAPRLRGLVLAGVIVAAVLVVGGAFGGGVILGASTHGFHRPGIQQTEHNRYPGQRGDDARQFGGQQRDDGQPGHQFDQQGNQRGGSGGQTAPSATPTPVG